MRLPAPSAPHAAGRKLVIKKTDAGGSAVTVTATAGTGAEGRAWVLRAQYDGLKVVSTGAAWSVVAQLSNVGDVEYLKGESMIAGKAGRAFYGVSAYAGPVTFQLPTLELPKAVGKPMTIKRLDPGPDPVTVTLEGGGGSNRGKSNSDEISNVGFTYDRDIVNAMSYRLLGTGDMLRALILDLKMKGLLGDRTDGVGAWTLPS